MQTRVRTVYVVFLGSKSTRATFSKRAAIQCAKKNPGAQVRSMPRDQWREGGSFGWDAPTFRSASALAYQS